MIFKSDFGDMLYSNRRNAICYWLLNKKHDDVWKEGFDHVGLAVSDSTKIAFIPKNKTGCFINPYYSGTFKIKSGFLSKNIKSKYTTIQIVEKKDTGLIVQYHRYRSPMEKQLLPYFLFDIDNLDSNNLPPFAFWDNTLREQRAVMTTPAKFIAKFKVKPEFSNRDIEEFTNLFSVDILKASTSFMEVEGEDIIYWYHESKYDKYVHSLGSSCMRYDECDEYFGIYEDNNIRMLCLINNSTNKLLGRAILWDNVSFNKIVSDPKTFMDRIYAVDFRYESIFIEYAIEHGYVYKEFQSYSSKDKFMYNRIKFTDEVKIQLNESEYDKYPYTDTFSYINEDIIFNYIPEKLNCKELSDTDGGYSETHKWSSYCEEYIINEESTYLSYHDSFINNRDAVNVFKGRNSIYIHTDAIETDCYKCDICGNYYIKEECGGNSHCCECYVKSNYENKFILKGNSIILYNGEYCSKELVIYSPHISGYIIKEDAIDHKIHGWIPKGLVEKIEKQYKESISY